MYYALSNFSYFSTGSEDDDSSCSNIRCLLAAVPRIFLGDIILPGRCQLHAHSRDLPGHILAGHEQFHV